MMYEEDNFFEKCWFIYGIKIKKIYIGIIVKHSNGKRAGVKFNWKKIYNSKYLIGFFHTHPGHNIRYSCTDRDTMNAWVFCLWRDLICGIWSEDKSINNCYLFKTNKSIKVMKRTWSKFLFFGME